MELILVKLQANSVLLYYKNTSPQIIFGICTYSYLKKYFEKKVYCEPTL